MDYFEIKQRTREWAEHQGLSVARGPHCPRRLHGGRHEPVGCDCMAGWADHGLLLERDGELVAFASEPYGLGPDDLADLLKYAEEQGLEVGLQPGVVRERTILVTLRTRAS